MSVGRSPIKGKYSSQPDLAKLQQTDDLDMQVTLRKRKQPPGPDCTCTKQITMFREEMTSLFKAFTDNQREFSKTLHEDMIQIKTKIDTLQVTTEKLAADNNVLKQDVLQLKQHTSQTDEKVKGLQNDINVLKDETSKNIIKKCEISERTDRAKNIIIYGIAESEEANVEEKQEHDKNEVFNIVRSIMDTVPTPKKVVRLGKFNPMKIRPVKVYFDCAQISKQLMRNKNKIEKKDVKIYADLTPTQQNHLKLLRQDLLIRKENDSFNYPTKKLRSINTNNYQSPTQDDIQLTHELPDSYQHLSMNETSLNIFYTNIRSIVKPGKLDELECIIHSTPRKLHLILLTETWIKSDEEKKTIQITNYYHYSNIRTDGRGGGVSIFVHNDLKHHLLEESYTNGNNYLWIHIDKLDLDIGVIYKPGDTNHSSFLDDFELNLQRKRRAVVFGDFNLNLLSPDRNTARYSDLLKEFGFSILNKIDVNYSTRKSLTTNSILDHVLTNLTGNKFNISLLDSSLSDHVQIFGCIEKFKVNKKQRVKYEAIDYEALFSLAEKYNFNSKNNNYNELDSSIKNCIVKSTTSKTKILNLPRSDWINKHIINNINYRNELWQSLKKNPNSTKFQENFAKQRNKTKQLIANSKNKYYAKKFFQCKNDPKKTWTLVNELSCNKIRHESNPPKLIKDSVAITDGDTICEIFNDFFVNIGLDLAREIPMQYHNNLTYTVSHLSSTTNQLSSLTLCTEEEISKIIDNLDSNSSAGLDGISTKCIKCIKHHIISQLTKCINECLNRGIFPDELKVARVSPIHKSGPKTDPGNYRPISVLPVISKVFERVLYNRLDNYLNKIGFYFQRQYGFRTKSNTLSATIDLVTKIRSSIDAKNLVLGVFIDLKKAFDTSSFVPRPLPARAQSDLPAAQCCKWISIDTSVARWWTHCAGAAGSASARAQRHYRRSARLDQSLDAIMRRVNHEG
ncbi:hypothetical protein MSG28_007816 [Choristoneura fumiferana]|uniref:Uncharacterized protein n=1 Tax=Choristoneura fumiferana TaxID=7141 RepID=A0ACC0JYW5_CHOFU|nr:hypothetical protein MSG28_007816 [Choristoneura fumiferana]